MQPVRRARPRHIPESSMLEEFPLHGRHPCDRPRRPAPHPRGDRGLAGHGDHPGLGPAHRGPVRRSLRMRHLPRLRRRGLARQALSRHRGGGGPARHGGHAAEFPPLLPDPLDPRTRRPGGHPRARPAADRHPATLPKTERPCFSKGLSKEPVHDRQYRNGRRHHRRRARGPVRRVRARAPRHQMPPHRHPAESGRPMRRALSGKADLRHPGLSRWSRARASSTT